MAKTKKYDGGGSIENMSEDELMARSAKAYDKAMPKADTTYGYLARGINPPSKSAGLPPLKTKYSSVRDAGFEEGVNAEKMAALKQGARGAGMALKNAAMVAVPGGVLAADHNEVDRGIKMARGASDKYKSASARQDAADRELASQMRRETRGVEYKKGGSVKASASRRADGIAQRGKTKGRMI
jgi:hypothetical protein